MKYRLGQYFTTTAFGTPEMLFMIAVAQHAKRSANKKAKVSLIVVQTALGINAGASLEHNPIEVEDTLDITEEEFRKLCGGFKFTPVLVTMTRV